MQSIFGSAMKATTVLFSATSLYNKINRSDMFTPEELSRHFEPVKGEYISRTMSEQEAKSGMSGLKNDASVSIINIQGANAKTFGQHSLAQPANRFQGGVYRAMFYGINTQATEGSESFFEKTTRLQPLYGEDAKSQLRGVTEHYSTNSVSGMNEVISRLSPDYYRESDPVISDNVDSFLAKLNVNREEQVEFVKSTNQLKQAHGLETGFLYYDSNGQLHRPKPECKDDIEKIFSKRLTEDRESLTSKVKSFMNGNSESHSR